MGKAGFEGYAGPVIRDAVHWLSPLRYAPSQSGSSCVKLVGRRCFSPSMKVLVRPSLMLANFVCDFHSVTNPAESSVPSASLATPPTDLMIAPVAFSWSHSVL